MKKTIKKMLMVAAMAVGAAGWWQTALAGVRVDARTTLIATGVETRGSADGSGVTSWDTTKEADGWKRLSSGGSTVSVLVLNNPLVSGGRMTANATWSKSRVVVVRDDVLVPSGKKLTIGFGTVVKFAPGARIVVEDGGSLSVRGACFADLADDSVDGDTNLDEGRSAPSGEKWWLAEPAMKALSTVRFVDGAVTLPTRSYSAGATYGTLPELSKDGAKFGGWLATVNGVVEQATPAGTVPAGETVLRAYWIPYTLSIEPGSATVAATGGSGTIEVVSNDDWESSSSASWVKVTAKDGEVAYTVGENASTQPRTATIRVVSTNGLSRDFTVQQVAMEVLAAPTINPPDGTTFYGPSRRISITSPDPDAQIRYTVDGSEPTETSTLYAKSFNVFDTTIVKTKIFKKGMLPSETVEAVFVRLETLAEAMDVPLWTVETEDEHPWETTTEESRDGASSVRSGEVGHNQTSTLTAKIEGCGTLSFWWKTDCEDDPDGANWDCLIFKKDGIEVARLDGDSGWQQVTVSVKGDWLHTLTWTYSKDEADDEPGACEDCGWVDQVNWVSQVGYTDVPNGWLELRGLVREGATAVDAANEDVDGDGMTAAEEYLAGTDPTDADSKFVAYYSQVDGKPVITYSPDLMDEREYTIQGKKTASDEEWVAIPAGKEADYLLYRVAAKMPSTLGDVNSNTVYTVNYVGQSYDVTFNANGGTGTMAAQPFIKGVPQKLNANAFKRTGYKFLGWAKSATGAVVYKDGLSITVSAAMTLYAKWEAIAQTYTINFYRYDGTDAAASRTFTYGVSTKLPTVASLGWARRGFTFKGWATSEANAKAKKIWKTDAAAVATAVQPGKTLSVYAVWELDAATSYAIIFVRNEGSGYMRTLGYKYGVSTALPTINGLGWARRGYDFKGWATSTANARDGKVWKTDGAKVVTAAAKGKSLTVYAVWQLKAGYYSIRFNKNDGTGKWRELGYEYGKKTRLPTCGNGLGWTREGYVFAGWALGAANAAAGVKWKADWAYVSTPTTAGKTISIYALWTPVAKSQAAVRSAACTAGVSDPASESCLLDEPDGLYLVVDDAGVCGALAVDADGRGALTLVDGLTYDAEPLGGDVWWCAELSLGLRLDATARTATLFE